MARRRRYTVGLYYPLGWFGTLYSLSGESYLLVLSTVEYFCCRGDPSRNVHISLFSILFLKKKMSTMSSRGLLSQDAIQKTTQLDQSARIDEVDPDRWDVQIRGVAGGWVGGLFRMDRPGNIFKVSVNLNIDSFFFHSKLSTNSYISRSYNCHYITKSNSVSL